MCNRLSIPDLMASGEQNTISDEQTLIEILDPSTPISIQKYTDFVRSPNCGAISSFEGTTRDTFDGKRVLSLEYESYVPMAVKQLKSICDDARVSHPGVHRIAVAHRLGTVGVGEASVFVAVSSVHRAEAMEVCRYVIDELKSSVPIWKKEVYENGEVWKENREFVGRKICCGHKVKVVD